MTAPLDAAHHREAWVACGHAHDVQPRPCREHLVAGRSLDDLILMNVVRVGEDFGEEGVSEQEDYR